MELLYKKYLEATGVTTDSRNVPVGSMFFALKGDRFDGNQYALQALEKGAAYCVVDDENLPAHKQLIRVPNVLDSLQQLAGYHRKKLGIPVIGITGTNGKTTTKELVYAVLSQKYKVYATRGNLNNHIGVPLTLLAMDRSIQLAVVEMGASKPGDIKELCDIAQPDYGLITNVGRAHLEGFGSFENIIKTKSELYQSVNENNGTLIYNVDNEYLKRSVSEMLCDKIMYGNVPEALVSGQLIAADPFLRFQLKVHGEEIAVNTKLIGAYNLENALAAACIGALFEVNACDIKQGIELYAPSNNRSQLIKTPQHTVWADCYNANPSSMRAAIDNFAHTEEAGVDKVLILGDMLELGDDSATEHDGVLNLINSYQWRQVILVGQEFANFKDKYPFLFLKETDDLIAYFQQNPFNQTVLLVKGSRGIGLDKILPLL